MCKTALFLTYNSVGNPGSYPNGKVERNGLIAIIVQHPRGERWGAQLSNGREPVAKPGEPDNLEDARSEEERQQMLEEKKARTSMVQTLYSEALGLTDLPDYVVVYVGTGGSEGAIDLASQLPVDRLRFVLCDCNLQDKLEKIQHRMEHDVPFLLCECGGQRTMARLVEQFFDTGLVGPEADNALAR